jgi:tetratricopeptide (TPR) repeat protein
MDGEALILLGQYFARKDNPEKAVFYYERAEAIEAVEAKAKIRHAQLLVQESKYQEAVPLLENALRIEHRSEVEEYLTQVKAAAKSRQ